MAQMRGHVTLILEVGFWISHLAELLFFKTNDLFFPHFISKIFLLLPFSRFFGKCRFASVAKFWYFLKQRVIELVEKLENAKLS